MGTAEQWARPMRTRTLGILREGMAIDTHARTRVSTSGRAPGIFGSNTKATPGLRSRATCRRSHRSRSRSWTPDRGRLRIPPTLPPLFPGMPRRLELEARTVSDLLQQLDQRWPGFRTAWCEPGLTLRSHIHVYVDGERVGLDGAIKPTSRSTWTASAISGGLIGKDLAGFWSRGSSICVMTRSPARQ